MESPSGQEQARPTPNSMPGTKQTSQLANLGPSHLSLPGNQTGEAFHTLRIGVKTKQVKLIIKITTTKNLKPATDQITRVSQLWHC